MNAEDDKTNLSYRATRDLASVIERSYRDFGAAQAGRLEKRILDTCSEIAQGANRGHLRRDVIISRPTRFIVVDPILVAYNPETRTVVRIIDGRRNLTKLFGKS